MRLFLPRVRVLPLVGENRNDDDQNEREHACEPDGRIRKDACLRGRHRALTLPGDWRSVKSLVVALVHLVRFTGRRPKPQRRDGGRATRPVGQNDVLRAFCVLSRAEVAKTENNIDSHSFPVTLGSSMQRTPNAAKPVIFAFVARISLR
jgi:hypothetical protein